MVIDVKKSNTYFIQGMLFLIFAQIMVGINIVFSKYVLSSIPVLYILALRFTLAAVILLLLHWLTPAKKLPMYS
ncbi:TPA: EamA family transporter, partial [Legionella pneumophila]|nr:EamA family transporter [Legionella pneumophila]